MVSHNINGVHFKTTIFNIAGIHLQKVERKSDNTTEDTICEFTRSTQFFATQCTHTAKKIPPKQHWCDCKHSVLR